MKNEDSKKPIPKELNDEKMDEISDGCSTSEDSEPLSDAVLTEASGGVYYNGGEYVDDERIKDEPLLIIPIV